MYRIVTTPMIIACPECSSPFEVQDQAIAPLVQVACPNCQFRMILDFEAANNPSLMDPGMGTANGFRSAADYLAAAGGAIPADTETVSSPAPLSQADAPAPAAAAATTPPALASMW